MTLISHSGPCSPAWKCPACNARADLERTAPARAEAAEEAARAHAFSTMVQADAERNRRAEAERLRAQREDASRKLVAKTRKQVAERLLERAAREEQAALAAVAGSTAAAEAFAKGGIAAVQDQQALERYRRKSAAKRSKVSTGACGEAEEYARYTKPLPSLRSAPVDDTIRFR
jgi:maltooligosyltrehalose synthase